MSDDVWIPEENSSDELRKVKVLVPSLVDVLEYTLLLRSFTTYIVYLECQHLCLKVLGGMIITKTVGGSKQSVVLPTSTLSWIKAMLLPQLPSSVCMSCVFTLLIWLSFFSKRCLDPRKQWCYCLSHHNGQTKSIYCIWPFSLFKDVGVQCPPCQHVPSTHQNPWLLMSVQSHMS